MKKTFATLLAVLSFGLVLNGCVSSESDNAYNKRQQMFDAQKASIDSIENEILRIREGNGGDMTKWSADTIALYKKWQEELALRYQEREKLIKAMSGDTMSEMPR